MNWIFFRPTPKVNDGEQDIKNMLAAVIHQVGHLLNAANKQ